MFGVETEKMKAVDESRGRLFEFDGAPVSLPGCNGRKDHLQRLRAEPLHGAGIDGDIRAAMGKEMLGERRRGLEIEDWIKRHNSHAVMNILQIGHCLPPALRKTPRTFGGKNYQQLPAPAAPTITLVDFCEQRFQNLTGRIRRSSA